MTLENETDTKNPKGSTVTRVLDILNAVADADRPLSPTEVAEQLAIPKAPIAYVRRLRSMVTYRHA